VALGPAADAAALAVAVAGQPDIDIGSVSLPRDADVHLQPSYVLDPRNDWEWFVTWEAPPAQPHEDRVRWLDEQVDGDDITALLAEWSPRHDVMPGDQGVRRWCGLRGDNGLLAVAAHTEHRPGVPHLASIATTGAVRRRGLGAAVTAWLTRQLLAEGTGWVTLGMYSDNDVARRMYLRLGYQCDHRFTSGRLIEV
jgi:GNAT superfamily N-acetyltransferase